MKNLFALLGLIINLGLNSCTKDGVSAGGSRKVKYEITGNYTGSIIIGFTASNNSLEIAEINKFPWSLEMNADANVKVVTFTGTGTGGMMGQKITGKIYVGDKEVAKGEGTAISSGIISFNPSLVTL